LDLPSLIDPALLTVGNLAISGLAVVVSAFIRGLTGFGFALAAVPLLSLSVAPTVAVPLVLWLTVLGGLLDIRSSLRSCHWPSMRWLQAGAIVGIPIGSLGLALIPAATARIGIGFITFAAVAALARGASFSIVPGKGITVAAGLVSGIFGGLAGMPGPPAVAYYAASPLGRVEVRASLLVLFTAVAALGLINAALLQVLGLQSFLLAVLALPLVYLGQVLGQRCCEFGSDHVHRWIAIVALVGIAFSSILKGLLDML
jgi:uncharacterized protein